jgi:L-threonylcarbamoyladenylate synthase
MGMHTAREWATPRAIARAADILKTGGLVAFPTETVYGLGGDALNAMAAASIFRAKQRALNDPLIVHVAHRRDVERVARPEILTASQRAIAEARRRAFWPGPLTLVLPKCDSVPAIVSAGLESVGVRLPNHPIATALIDAADTPIAAPSANLFGHVSPTAAEHVLTDLDGRIDMVLDGGPTRIGVESTVLSVLGDAPMILRHGGVTRAMIEALGVRLATQAPVDEHDDTPVSAMPAPGMLASHYAPRARLELYATLDALLDRHAALSAGGSRCGLLIQTAHDERCRELSPRFVLGDTADDIARALYAGLRAVDAGAVDVILCIEPDLPPGGLGDAIRDRLARAAAKRD